MVHSFAAQQFLGCRVGGILSFHRIGRIAGLLLGHRTPFESADMGIAQILQKFAGQRSQLTRFTGGDTGGGDVGGVAHITVIVLVVDRILRRLDAARPVTRLP